MSAVVLDAGPLGLATNPRRSPESTACAHWLQALVAKQVRVIVPEIADYEVRRELIRAGKTPGLARLDALGDSLEYLPITSEAMRKAAALWARVRRQGRPTADDKALDADVILAAQALTLGEPDVLVATTNVGHLSRLVAEARWTDIADS
ncbi:MAG: PIN domain-containing protein [Planctomycetales bacterium]